LEGTLLKKTAYDSYKDAHNQSVCVANPRGKEQLENSSDIFGNVSERLHTMLCGTQEDTNTDAGS
jgi:hypothetical protein